MLLGIPRGFFYYDYMGFINRLFQNTDVRIYTGDANNEEILAMGCRRSVDEACFPIKLFVGQVEHLTDKCDKVLIPRVMKDCRGRWLCPKLLGLPELSWDVSAGDKMLVTEPIYFDDEEKTRKSMRRLCRGLKMRRSVFEKNFAKAYGAQKNIAAGLKNVHVEIGWEFTPPLPKEGEIILPNTRKVLLAGHCYNVYDKFANGDIMKKLDDLGIEAITDRHVNPLDRERAVERLDLIKEPFWEAFIRVLGSALCLKEQVDGIIYLSSFSCGPDAFIVEMLKTYVKDIPIMVLKLDEHRGEAGFETRIEAFADLLEKRHTA